MSPVPTKQVRRVGNKILVCDDNGIKTVATECCQCEFIDDSGQEITQGNPADCSRCSGTISITFHNVCVLYVPDSHLYCDGPFTFSQTVTRVGTSCLWLSGEDFVLCNQAGYQILITDVLCFIRIQPEPLTIVLFRAAVITPNDLIIEITQYSRTQGPNELCPLVGQYDFQHSLQLVDEPFWRLDPGHATID